MIKEKKIPRVGGENGEMKCDVSAQKINIDFTSNEAVYLCCG